MVTGATIVLTAAQADHVAWAIDPMECYFADLFDDGEIDAVPPLPRLDGRVLTVPGDELAIADILYRLEEQLPGMAAEEPGTQSSVRAALNAADKIREATTFTGPSLGSVCPSQ